MAYSNEAVATGQDVIQKIRAFAVSKGWIVHFDALRPADNTYWWVVMRHPNGGPYFSMMADTVSIHCNAHRTFDSGQDYNTQPDQFYSASIADKTKINLLVTPLLSVHLFSENTGDPYVYCAIEIEPGYYRHLVFGFMTKFVPSLGGFFFDISESEEGRESTLGNYQYPFMMKITGGLSTGGGLDCQDRAGTPAWYTLSASYRSSYSASGAPWGCLDELKELSPDGYTSRSNLLPLMIVAMTGSTFTPYGSPPNFRYIPMDFYQAGDEITIGTDIWKVFPVIRKRTGIYDNTRPQIEKEGTENFAIAYLKN